MSQVVWRTHAPRTERTAVTKYGCCYGTECPVCGDPPSYVEVDTKYFCATWVADHPERAASAEETSDDVGAKEAAP